MARESILQKKEPNVNKELLSGNLEETSFFDVCREIALPKWTGILKVEAGKIKHLFYFKKGDIIYSENSKEKTEEKILDMVRRSGLISRETFSTSEKKKAKLMRTLLEILVEDGHVSMLLYSKIISATVRMNVLKAILLRKGKYSFTERKSIREVHGVKLVQILEIRDVATLVDSHPKSFKKITESFYNYVQESDKDFFISENKTVLQNYLLCEIDFFKFIDKAVTGLTENKWKIKGKCFSLPALQTASLYIFRTFVAAGVLFFLYLALITGSFKRTREPRSVKDFYYFKVNLISSLLEFQSGEVPREEQLIKSGLVREEEIDIIKRSE
jgi:hypothetical protein